MKQIYNSYGSPVGMLRAPGNGIVIAQAAHRVPDKKSPGGFRLVNVPIYGPAPIRTGKLYRDSGYPGSVRRRAERERSIAR